MATENEAPWMEALLDVDSTPQELVSEAKQERVAVLRTSDRILFKKCRRRWGWSSHLRGNLGPKRNASPLWFGSGIHFALEDIHGDRVYSSAVEAFRAYIRATKEHNKRSLPLDWKELGQLGISMLDYYEGHWLKTRDPLKTFVYRGIPQTEVNFKIDVPYDARHYGIDKVVYSGTLDRVAEIDGELWIVEYKTAKQIATLHYSTDPQVSTYCWAGNLLYDRPIEGVIYMQFLKREAEQPKLLSNGMISTDLRQKVPHAYYRDALLKLYGNVEKAPADNITCLNHLTSLADQDNDQFIQRHKIYRNLHSQQAEAAKILLECEDILNPNLPLYPNPTRDCTYMCPFLTSCVSMDDGSDWRYELSLDFEDREANYDSWRKKLPEPKPVLLLEKNSVPGVETVVKQLDGARNG